MKPLLCAGLGVVLGLAACHRRAETPPPPAAVAATDSAAAPTAPVAAAAQPAPAAEVPIVFGPPVLGTPPVPPPGPVPALPDFLRRYDLSPRWTIPYDANSNNPLNGFFGTDNYRIEFAFTEAQADSLRPNVFRVRGKDRFKRVVLPFEGFIVFDKLVNQPRLSAARKKKLSGSGPDEVFNGYPSAYTLTGHFVLREDSTQAKSGAFRGTITIDFRVDENGHILEYAPDELSASKGAGVLFAGFWTSYRTGQRKPLALFSDPFTFGNAVLADFTVGQRGVEFNPKYAKLGWTEYWANEEWWADAPAATNL